MAAGHRVTGRVRSPRADRAAGRNRAVHRMSLISENWGSFGSPFLFLRTGCSSRISVLRGRFTALRLCEAQQDRPLHAAAARGIQVSAETQLIESKRENLIRG